MMIDGVSRLLQQHNENDERRWKPSELRANLRQAQQSISTAALDLTISMIETGEIRMEYSHRVGDGVRGGLCIIKKRLFGFHPCSWEVTLKRRKTGRQKVPSL